MAKILIQHAQDTGRFHPAFYRWAPMPGPGPHVVERYKSAGHHTEGFLTEQEAQDECAVLVKELTEVYMVEEEAPWPVRVMAEAGADVLIEEPRDVLPEVADTYAALMARAAELNQRVKTCHERVPCPKCAAPIGQKCRRAGSGSKKPLKNPHQERWTQEVPKR